MHSALIFQIQKGKEKAEFTDEFKNCLKNAVNPKIFIAVGKMRGGKSSLLNHILLDKSKNLPKNLRLSSPFKAKGGENSTTKEFLFYGPIKVSEILRRNKLKFNGNEEDYDFFFIDSEGTGNLYQISKNLYHGIFLLESITTYILFVSKGIIDQEGFYIFQGIFKLVNCLTHL